ncbi:MAG: tRNA 2-thiouridine(34) synthase MnmA [Bacteroidales bacterium]|nr:tRNA 2-thiouridine(34) synthase MnmA [Bacteroidales bacterium]MBN2762413.1 tRNA 2-thiouridine(34) synthase MnmA [Bacteroidales bacterium]
MVGISGGVDSSVAAYLLKQQGYDVTGMFMINWHDTTGTLAGDCPWHDDLIFAKLVAKKLGIPLKTVDFSIEYKQRIVDYMFSEYEKGRTPNPDVLCNREVKFDLFLKAAVQEGADFIATGHYCRKKEIHTDERTAYRLLSGTDTGKDQSYFLCQLSQSQLQMALFPIGNLIKDQVRDIAREHGLATAERKDSQGLCFIGKIHLPDFLKQKLKPKPGAIVEIPADMPDFREYSNIHRHFLSTGEGISLLTKDFAYKKEDGMTIGKHNGAHYYTVGQRKGLNIGGKAKPLFVLQSDTKKNCLYVGMGHDHPGLNRWGLFIPASEIHWIRNDVALKPGDSERYLVRIRYRQALQHATLFRAKEGLYILFDRRQRGITPGQFAAWYDGEELLGSGVIQ